MWRPSNLLLLKRFLRGWHCNGQAVLVSWLSVFSLCHFVMHMRRSTAEHPLRALPQCSQATMASGYQPPDICQPGHAGSKNVCAHCACCFLQHFSLHLLSWCILRSSQDCQQLSGSLLRPAEAGCRHHQKVAASILLCNEFKPGLDGCRTVCSTLQACHLLQCVRFCLF